MRVLLIDSGEVANIANFDDDHVLVEGQILADDFPFAQIGWSVVDGKPSAPPVLSVPLADTKASAKRQMVAWIDRLTDQLRAGIPRDEIASWPAKSAEARAFLANGAAAPILQVEADLVGLTLTEVAATISARAALYETVVGAVAGIRRNTVAAIDAASDAEGVALALDEALATATAKATELGLVVAG